MEYQLSLILSGCKQDSPAWQKVLYEKYYGYAVSICMRYSANNEDTIEIMNDGFVKIFRSISRFIEPEDENILQKVFMSWFKTIMVNTGINHSKALARKISWTVTDEKMNNISSDNGRVSEDKMAYDELINLIRKLSPAYRNTFSLYALDGYTHEEISRILGISIGTSKSNLLKARKNLRKMLEKNHAEKI
ncbi:RNA polymerase sigma factor [Arachidicoccus sp.]|uniref:RNA polymerase sigma factor n=1 Tax=Arachidicoccus sp. TaxID=1872624 RepID=UPI003D1A9402